MNFLKPRTFLYWSNCHVPSFHPQPQPQPHPPHTAVWCFICCCLCGYLVLTVYVAHNPWDFGRTTVSQDALGSREKCRRRAQEVLQRGGRVIIDRCDPIGHAQRAFGRRIPFGVKFRSWYTQKKRRKCTGVLAVVVACIECLIAPRMHRFRPDRVFLSLPSVVVYCFP